MARDTIYSEEMNEIPPFEFNEGVARVFDDMADRSIPYYRLVEEMSADLALRFYIPGTVIYDLGCSTGTAMEIILNKAYDRGIEELSIKGIDSSPAMCSRAKKRLVKRTRPGQTVRVEEADILSLSFPSASVIIMNYTLQFISPFLRRKLLQRIYSGLVDNGILIVSDKILQSRPEVSRVFADAYYRFKKAMGYSELEISRKREALENVLIPYRQEEERGLLLDAGFNTVDLFFSWYNFSSFLCVKKGCSRD